MTRASLVCVGMLLCASVAFAGPSATVNLLQGLPPDMQVKMSKLAEILQGAIKSGRLSESQIQTTLNSGDAPAMIRSLGPEAAQLLQDIAVGYKGKYSEDELMIILGGLFEAK